VLYGKSDFIKKNPKTISAFLRAIVKADRIIQDQPQVAVDVLQKEMKLDPRIAQQAYEIDKDTFPSDGRLPANLDPIWKVLKAIGTVKDPLPESQWLDRTWLDNFDAWN
jgi:ABC-type nitrate/sulfonate/bicarbonate transport system substrate-binding protein